METKSCTTYFTNSERIKAANWAPPMTLAASGARRSSDFSCALVRVLDDRQTLVMVLNDGPHHAATLAPTVRPGTGRVWRVVIQWLVRSGLTEPFEQYGVVLIKSCSGHAGPSDGGSSPNMPILVAWLTVLPHQASVLRKRTEANPIQARFVFKILMTVHTPVK